MVLGIHRLTENSLEVDGIQEDLFSLHTYLFTYISTYKPYMHKYGIYHKISIHLTLDVLFIFSIRH